MLAGYGTGESFTGILNTVGIGTDAPGGAPETALEALRRARRKVEVDGRTTPNGIVLHPNDAEQIDLIRVNAEPAHYLGPGPYGPIQRTIWGMPVIETTAIPEGTGLVGDFRKAVLFDREQVTISVETVGDELHPEPSPCPRGVPGRVRRPLAEGVLQGHRAVGADVRHGGGSGGRTSSACEAAEERLD